MTSLRAASASHDLESPAASRPVIVFDAVRKVFAARRSSPEVGALDGVSLSVGAGEIVGVIGRSGAGKSTLIRLVNGLEKPSSGTVTVDGTVISALDERGLRAARRSIGMIFQHFNLLSSRTAFGNVALPLEIAGRPASEITQRVSMLLELVGLADKRDRYPAELSGGEKQRVGIARALATAPKVLLSDEATSALDPETTAQILALLKRINRELGLTILLITHEMAVVKSIAEKVIVLEAGRIIEQGATFDIFAHPQHPTTRSFVGTVTGSQLPEDIRARLKPDAFAGSQAVLKIVWSGDPSGERVLGQLARALSVEVSLLHGQIDSIAGRPFGTLSIALPDSALGAATEELARQGLQAEVLGHVA